MGINSISELVEEIFRELIIPQHYYFMPKILRIINRFNLGGPTYNAAYLSKYLTGDFETKLIGGQKEEHEDSSTYILENMGVKYSLIDEMKRRPSIIDDFKAFIKIKNIIRQYKPDIVHTHAAKAGYLGRIAAKQCGVKIIVHTYHGHVFHSYFGSFKTNIIKAIERWLAKMTTKIIVISEKQKEEISLIHKIAKPSKFEVIPLGFDLERFQTDYEIKRNSFRTKYHLNNHIAIGIVGRLVPIKNHDLFIKAIARLQKRIDRNVRYFIIGDGERMDELQKMAIKENISIAVPNENCSDKELVFTSWIKNIDWAFAGLDITCLCSFNEGTPVSLIESQAANTPIVSTKVGGVENIVIENETALLCNNNDLDDFTDKLENLITNDKRRKHMEINGANHVMDKFSHTRLCSNISHLYSNLLKQVEAK